MALAPYLSKVRRHIHASPELSFQEFHTSAYIAERLRDMGIPFQEGVAGTGIVALIQGDGPQDRCVALRADIDALPITELNETPYRSTRPGVMHACGHDAHTACLLGAAKILWEMRAELKGAVKLLFQPGEEQSPGGASLMIRDGALEGPRPFAIFGLHVYPELSVGHFGFRPGQYMASSDEIRIRITGKGGHGALPHLAIDPIPIAAQVITALQQIVSRKSNPLFPMVLTFGKIAGGTATNVIPDQVELWGTLRTFQEEERQKALGLIREITTQICAAFGAQALIDVPPGYPSLYNETALTEWAMGMAGHYNGDDHVHRLDMRMTAEDFAFYAREIPGCFFRLGTNRDHIAFTAAVHSPLFDLDENALSEGAGMMAYLAYEALIRASKSA